MTCWGGEVWKKAKVDRVIGGCEERDGEREREREREREGEREREREKA